MCTKWSPSRCPTRRARCRATGGVTWAEFDRRADGIAKVLLDNGAKRQDKLAHYLYNGPEYMETTFATFKAGMAPVNTNYRYAEDELVYLWDNADAVAVVFHGCFTERCDRVRDRVTKVKTWLWVDDGTDPCPEWATRYERKPPHRRPNARFRPTAATATTCCCCTPAAPPACPRA